MHETVRAELRETSANDRASISFSDTGDTVVLAETARPSASYTISRLLCYVAMSVILASAVVVV